MHRRPHHPHIAAPTITVILFAGLLLPFLLLLTSCNPAQEEKPKPVTLTDPYAEYLKVAPADAPKLSREDAQTRAYLGCGTQWAPGTVDAALATAYANLCK